MLLVQTNGDKLGTRATRGESNSDYTKQGGFDEKTDFLGVLRNSELFGQTERLVNRRRVLEHCISTNETHSTAQDDSAKKVNIWEVIVSVIAEKNSSYVHVYNSK